jgi:hypothetical protein
VLTISTTDAPLPRGFRRAPAAPDPDRYETPTSADVAADSSEAQAVEPDPSPANRTNRWWWTIAAVAVAACIGLHWQVARSATAPRTPWDENHLLVTARYLAGDHGVAPLSGSGYFPGWAVLLTPIWWFTDDAETVYHAAVTLGNVLAVATIIPLALIARRLGVSTPQAVTVAAIAMCFPGRTVLADYALSEQAIMFFLAWTVLAMHALWSRPTWWRALLFVLAVCSTYFMHSRELTVVLTAGVWLVLLALRRWQTALVGLVALVPGYILVKRLAEQIANAVLLTGFGKEELLSRIGLDQAWVQGVGTAGIAAIGALVVIVWTVHELRVLRPGPGTFYFGLAASAFAVSVVWWTRPEMLWAADDPRLDVWVYSRYIDQIAVLLCLVALVALLRTISGPVLLASAGMFGTLALPVVFWVAKDVPLYGSLYGPGNASAILPWTWMFPEEPYERPLQPTFTTPNSFWIWASLLVIGVLLIIWALRRRPGVIIGCVLVGSIALSLAADPTQKRDAPVDIEATVTQIEDSTGQQDLELDLNYSCHEVGLERDVALNWVPYWLSPRQVDYADPDAGVPFDTDLVVSCANWPDAATYGAKRVKGDTDYSYGVWVLPGELQDELAAKGMLEE